MERSSACALGCVALIQACGGSSTASPPRQVSEPTNDRVTVHEDAPITEWSMDWKQVGAEGPFKGSTHEILFDEAGGGDVLWITGPMYGGLATIRPSGERKYFPMPEGSHPHGLAFGADGQLFVSLESSGSIARVSDAGVVEEVVDIQMKLEGQSETINPAPHGIVVDAERGTTWFTGKRTSTVGWVGPDGAVKHVALGTLAAMPIYLRLGPKGGVWGPSCSATRSCTSHRRERSASTRSRPGTAGPLPSPRGLTATCGSPRSRVSGWHASTRVVGSPSSRSP